MTDRELLEQILIGQKETNQRIDELSTDISRLKRQVMKSTAELKGMDEMILDEVERVHNILYKHTQDTSKHTA